MSAREVKDELFAIDSDAHYALANFIADGDYEILAFRLDALARKAMDLRRVVSAIDTAGGDGRG